MTVHTCIDNHNGENHGDDDNNNNMTKLTPEPFRQVGSNDDVIHVEKRGTFVQQVVNILANINHIFNNNNNNNNNNNKNYNSHELLQPLPVPVKKEKKCRQVHHMIRVRTILVLGYWVLGNMHRYWVVLLLGDIFSCSDTQYNTNQRAVGTVHMPVKDYLLPLLTCTLTDAIVCLDTMLIRCCLLNTVIIVIIIECWDFLWSLLCSTQVSVLVLGIGIARGQYYWVLDIGCLSWYRSNPTHDRSSSSSLARSRRGL